MSDSWDWVEEELKKIQDDLPRDPDMVQVVDAISVADFWKRRYDEELMLWEKKLTIKDDERKQLQEQAQFHEMSIKELEIRLKELERRWESEKILLDDRLKAKEVESALERARASWEMRLKILEEENKSLKAHLGVSNGRTLASEEENNDFNAATQNVFSNKLMEKQLAKLEESLKKNEEESNKRLAKLEEEKNEVSKILAEKEKALADEKEKWGKLDSEVGQINAHMSKELSNLKAREKEHFTILEDLARGFSHRVRNYLGIMSGTVQLCTANYQMDPELKDQLNVVDANAQEMLKSIEEFLALAKIPQMSMENVNMNELIKNALAANEVKFKNKKVRIETNFAVDPIMFRADSKLMLEVFTNLIENSFEAIDTSGDITLSTNFDKETSSVSVKITDTGAGISEIHLKKIFQPYFSSKKGHKGLGTTIAKRIIDLHGGTMTVESVKGKGTSFEVKFLVNARKKE